MRPTGFIPAFRVRFTSEQPTILDARECTDGTTGASLRLAPWKNGLSGGALTMTATAEVIRTPVNTVGVSIAADAIATNARSSSRNARHLTPSSGQGLRGICLAANAGR